MTEERAKRKLTAILRADVKGYSQLMGEDELATVPTLEANREVMAQLIRQGTTIILSTIIVKNDR